MDGIKYEFTTKLWIVGANYESHVKVFEDRAVISRTGRTGGLPSDSTIYFRDATSVSWGNAVGRAWITFSVPGVASSENQIITAVKPGTVAFAGPSIPYKDPFSIVFGMKQEDDVQCHYNEIKKVFDTYKENAAIPQPVAVIQQESVMDKLKKLKELKEADILSEVEYEEKRRKLLDEI